MKKWTMLMCALAMTFGCVACCKKEKCPKAKKGHKMKMMKYSSKSNLTTKQCQKLFELQSDLMYYYQQPLENRGAQVAFVRLYNYVTCNITDEEILDVLYKMNECYQCWYTAFGEYDRKTAEKYSNLFWHRWANEFQICIEVKCRTK